MPPIEALEDIAQRVAEEPLSDETMTIANDEDRSTIPFYDRGADEVHQPAAQRPGASDEARGNEGEGRGSAPSAVAPEQGAPRAGPSGTRPGAGQSLPTEVVDTDLGPAVQTYVPGAEKASDVELAKRRAQAPLKANADQKFTGEAGTLFGGPAPDPDAQGDMLAPKPRAALDARSRGPAAERASKAITRVLETRKSAVGAVRRPDLGPITIDYGKPGSPRKKFKDGWGLSHIVARRDLEGRDGESFVRNTLPEALLHGVPANERGPTDARRIDLVFGEHRAVLSLHRFEKRETWLLTAFTRENGSGGEANVTPDRRLRTASSQFSDAEGAEPAKHITPRPPPGKPALESRSTEPASEPVFYSGLLRAVEGTPPQSLAVVQARRAIERVLKTRKSAVGAVRRSDLGPIIIDYGKPGNLLHDFNTCQPAASAKCSIRAWRWRASPILWADSRGSACAAISSHLISWSAASATRPPIVVATRRSSPSVRPSFGHP